MTRSSQLRAARLAGGVLMLAAVVPAVTATAAFAADAPAPAATTSADAAYVNEVAIGTAVKIAAPGVAAAPKSVVKAADSTPSASVDATSEETEPVDESTVTATPSDAEVIETDSIQNSDPTEVAVLGTKIGSGQLADTGPSQVTTQALLALALIVAGVALRAGPSLATAAARRRH